MNLPEVQEDANVMHPCETDVALSLLVCKVGRPGCEATDTATSFQ
jgi:hypothetical protein